MLGALERPLRVSSSAQLGPTIFDLPQPQLGSTELDLLRELLAVVTRLEQWQRQFDERRLINRLRRWGRVLWLRVNRFWVRGAD